MLDGWLWWNYLSGMDQPPASVRRITIGRETQANPETRFTKKAYALDRELSFSEP
jgi:hypothetical protein